MVDRLTQDGFDNVHTEPVMVPKWVRGEENCQMILPRVKPISILGLGTSVGTGAAPLEASVLVVRSFDELRQRAAEAVGKIVVFNQPFVSYGVSSAYRTAGASEAARAGAVAALIRSVTPFSLYSPHTGVQHYQDNVTQIPAACITVEDAELMWRIQQRGTAIRVKLYMQAQNLPQVLSRNVVADLRGCTCVVILFSFVLRRFLQRRTRIRLLSFLVILTAGMSVRALKTMVGPLFPCGRFSKSRRRCGKRFTVRLEILTRFQLGLRPRRTLRLILWTCEEFGGIGGKAYFAAHQQNISQNFVLAIESDLGAFKPTGFGISGSSQAFDIVSEVAQLTSSLNSTSVVKGGGGEDIGPMGSVGVPTMSPTTMDSLYFWYHHTNADTMTAIQPENMDLLTAAVGVMAYTVADLKERLPRD